MIQDKIKLAIESESYPIYNWMCGLGLRGTALCVYAYIFDILRHEPHTPMIIKTTDIMKAVNASSYETIAYETNLLVSMRLIFKKSVNRKIYYSLYSFED